MQQKKPVHHYNSLQEEVREKYKSIPVIIERKSWAIPIFIAMWISN